MTENNENYQGKTYNISPLFVSVPNILYNEFKEII